MTQPSIIEDIVAGLRAKPLVLGVTLGIAAGYLTNRLSAQNLPRLHRVAVIGFPRAGKTSLITAVLDYFRRSTIRGVPAIFRGDDTIERLNDNLRNLESGKGIRSTRDQDVFAYRVDIKAPSVLFGLRLPLIPTWYKLEFGDYPGDDSAKFVEEFDGWLNRTPYFRWALEANSYIFVIDSQLVLGPGSDEYIARQNAAFTAAWDHLKDHYFEGPRSLKSVPLVLVFTKFDLALKTLEEDGNPVVVGNEAERFILRQFRSLIDYLSRESSRFDVRFVSLFLSAGLQANSDGVFSGLGVDAVARDVLPALAFPDKIYEKIY